MLETVQYFAVPLPEDIARLELAGELEAALSLIRRRLEGELPAALRQRLTLELSRIPALEEEYCYSYADALALLQRSIRDFTEQEFRELIDANQVDWIFKNGTRYFIDTFYDNLRKVQHPVTKRLIEPEDAQAAAKKQAVLNDNMRFMKEHGGNAYRFRIRTTLQIEEGTQRLGAPITVHLPIPQAGTQVRNIVIHAASPGGATAPEDNESRTICFQGPLQPNQAFFVEYSYETQVAYVELNPARAAPEQPTFCTGEQAPHILFTPYLRHLYREVVGEEANPVLIAKRIYDYITTHIKYSYVRKYSTILNIPEYAAANGKGDCGVQALLFITLCRLGGIPARWQSGLFAAPHDIGGHDWAQFYIAPYGWLFADLSFGGSAHRLGNEERRAFYFGNLDPFRMPANAAFQQEFTPPKRHMRHDPTDNQYGECEYEDRGLLRSEFISKHELLCAEQIAWEGGVVV